MSDKQTHEVLENTITIICEVTKQDIPLWKILPFKFMLYPLMMPTISISKI